MKKKSKSKVPEKPKKPKTELSQEEINTLEQLIKEDSLKPNFLDIKKELENLKIEFSPSLEKINAPLKNPLRNLADIEENLKQKNSSTPGVYKTKSEEENKINYLQDKAEEEKKYESPYKESQAEFSGRDRIGMHNLPKTYTERIIKINPTQETNLYTQNDSRDYSVPDLKIKKFEEVEKIRKNTLNERI